MKITSELMNLPAHEASLHLTHNQHKSYYQTVQQAIDDKTHGYNDRDWVTPAQRDLAIANNECWTLQWYPRTPVGFNLASAATLEALLEYVSKESWA